MSAILAPTAPAPEIVAAAIVAKLLFGFVEFLATEVTACEQGCGRLVTEADTLSGCGHWVCEDCTDGGVGSEHEIHCGDYSASLVE